MLFHWDKPAASFCHQMAAWVQYMFCNFYLVKKYKIVNNSRTTTAREKISRDLESLEFYKKFAVVWLNLKIIEFNLLKLAKDF
jgi:hypothetical protein